MDFVRPLHLPWLEMKVNREDPAYARRRHSHKEISLGIIDLSDTVILLREKEYTMHPRDAIFIPPQVIHLCTPRDEEHYRFRMLYVDPEWFYDAFSLSPGNIRPGVGALDRELYDRSLAFTRRLAEEKDTPDPLEIESELIPLMGEILRQLRSFPLDLQESCAGLEDVRKEMDKKYKEGLTLDYLSGLSGISKFSFLRAFKKEYHLSPHAYIVNRRIEFCRQSLKESRREMADIALEAGFTDQSHFIRTFKQYVGLAPGDYR